MKLQQETDFTSCGGWLHNVRTCLIFATLWGGDGLDLSGDVHFHWAVKLFSKISFSPPKATMRQRYHIATHWSCSHSQFWSAARYLTASSDHKEEPVDLTKLHVWTWDGRELDLFEESQEAFMAPVWKRRRDANELALFALLLFGTYKSYDHKKLLF